MYLSAMAVLEWNPTVAINEVTRNDLRTVCIKMLIKLAFWSLTNLEQWNLAIKLLRIASATSAVRKLRIEESIQSNVQVFLPRLECIESDGLHPFLTDAAFLVPLHLAPILHFPLLEYQFGLFRISFLVIAFEKLDTIDNSFNYTFRNIKHTPDLEDCSLVTHVKPHVISIICCLKNSCPIRFRKN